MGFKIFAVFCAVSASLMAAEVRIIEQIVAKVNGDIVTQGELDRIVAPLLDALELMHAQNSSRGTPSVGSQFVGNSLQRFRAHPKTNDGRVYDGICALRVPA